VLLLSAFSSLPFSWLPLFYSPFHSSWKFCNDEMLQLVECIELLKNEVKKKMTIRLREVVVPKSCETSFHRLRPGNDKKKFSNASETMQSSHHSREVNMRFNVSAKKSYQPFVEVVVAVAVRRITPARIYNE
jgi:hypothetical protein